MTYNGAITGPGTLEKQAAGKLNLSGIHDYTGPTLINAGTLFLIGEIQNSPITVNATLSGTGAIGGPVTVQSTGTLSPGASIGTLTISNTLILSGNTLIELNAATGASDQIRGLTTITFGGKLTLSNLIGGLTATNTFKLFDAQSYTGAFSSLAPSTPGPNLAWITNTLITDGTLRLTATSSPTTLAHSLSGKSLTLTWPPNQGWRLQFQTNSNTIGLSSNWQDVPDSAQTNQQTFPFIRNDESAFFRLILAP
jgi:autotransporter-associated beta strand protein